MSSIQEPFHANIIWERRNKEQKLVINNCLFASGTSTYIDREQRRPIIISIFLIHSAPRTLAVWLPIFSCTEPAVYSFPPQLPSFRPATAPSRTTCDFIARTRKKWRRGKKKEKEEQRTRAKTKEMELDESKNNRGWRIFPTRKDIFPTCKKKKKRHLTIAPFA